MNILKRIKLYKSLIALLLLVPSNIYSMERYHNINNNMAFFYTNNNKEQIPQKINALLEGDKLYRLISHLCRYPSPKNMSYLKHIVFPHNLEQNQDIHKFASGTFYIPVTKLKKPVNMDFDAFIKVLNCDYYLNQLVNKMNINDKEFLNNCANRIKDFKTLYDNMLKNINSNGTPLKHWTCI